jgi:hypothetical protein
VACGFSFGLPNQRIMITPAKNVTFHWLSILFSSP